MSIFLIDIHSHFKFDKILQNLKAHNKAVKFKYISYKKELKNPELNFFSNKIDYTYDDILNIKPEKFCLPGNVDRDEIYNYLDQMLSDPKLISIFERSYFKIFYNTNRIRIISILFFKAINFLNNLKPQAYFLYATPHNIDNFIFKWACFALNIDLIYLQESLLPWRFYVFIEKKNKKYLLNYGDKWCQDDLFLIDYLKNNKVLAPYVMDDKKKFFSIFSELKKYWKRPDLIINKFKIYNYYKNITRNFKLPKSDYIFFPLHYTPERSTLPDGEKYFEQFRAIHEIRSKLGNIKIVIKEHPSIFLHVCHWGERNKFFYNAIKNLDNIIFAPINYSTKKLIKNSLCIIAINSSVILEGLILNKSSFYMSDHRFFGHESLNLHRFNYLSKKKIFAVLKKKKSNIFNKDWFLNYTFLSKISKTRYYENISSIRSDRSENYIRMINQLIELYLKKKINKYIKKLESSKN